MKKIRVAGLVEMSGGFALMHRKNVKPTPNSTMPSGDYYVFPGGGLEESDKSFEDGVAREIFEEFGIIVNVKEKLYYKKINAEREEYLYKCEYVSGKLGTGTGPEFSGDPKYKSRGEYIPTIVFKEEFKNARILPEEFKEKIIEDYNL